MGSYFRANASHVATTEFKKVKISILLRGGAPKAT